MKRIVSALLSLTAAGVVFAAGGCSSDEPAEAAPAAATLPVCDAAADVRLTVEHIRQVNVSENGLGALRPYLQQLDSQLQVLKSEAQAQFGAQADQLRTAVDQLRASIGTARGNPDAAALNSVRTAVAGVRTTAQSLGDSAGANCPNA
jgi:hypothetical protein